MARPTRDAIDTFMRITGASQSLAVRKLEEYGGNLDDAVNAHFREVEEHMNPISAASSQHNFTGARNQVQEGPPRLLPLLAAVRSFKPSLLLDPNYRRNLWNQIGGTVFTNRERKFAHPQFYEQHHHPGQRPVIENGSATPLSHHPQIHGNVMRDDESHLEGNDFEEEMIKVAIEASRLELGLQDDEYAHAVSLSLKTAEQENAMREQALEDKKQLLGVRELGGQADKFGMGRWKSRSLSLQEGAEEIPVAPLWGGISSKELDEAILLEKAFFGEIPGGTTSQHVPYQQCAPDKPCPSSSSIMDQRLLREQQDDEYLASLLADLEKEASNVKETEASCLKEGESHNNMLEGEEFERMLAAKEALLPQEPNIDDEDAITLLVRMPDGSRCGRRFLKSDKLQFLFDFIEVGRAVQPGSYRLVRPYPRHAFSVGDGSLSLNEVGFTGKQEALFLELI